MTRTEELLSIGLFRIIEISEMLSMDTDTIRHRIKKLEIIPFERWWYDEYQIRMIKDYFLYVGNKDN